MLSFKILCEISLFVHVKIHQNQCISFDSNAFVLMITWQSLCFVVQCFYNFFTTFKFILIVFRRVKIPKFRTFEVLQCMKSPTSRIPLSRPLFYPLKQNQNSHLLFLKFILLNSLHQA